MCPNYSLLVLKKYSSLEIIDFYGSMSCRLFPVLEFSVIFSALHDVNDGLDIVSCLVQSSHLVTISIKLLSYSVRPRY